MTWSGLASMGRLYINVSHRNPAIFDLYLLYAMADHDIARPASRVDWYIDASSSPYVE